MRLAILVKAVVLSGAIAKLKQNIPILIDSLLEQSTFNSNLLRKLSSLTYILTSSSFCSSCAAEIILPLSQTGKKIKFCRKKEVLNTRHLYILVYCFTKVQSEIFLITRKKQFPLLLLVIKPDCTQTQKSQSFERNPENEIKFCCIFIKRLDKHSETKSRWRYKLF